MQDSVPSAHATTQPDLTAFSQAVKLFIKRSGKQQRLKTLLETLTRCGAIFAICAIHAAIGNPRVMSVPSRSHSAHRVPSRHNATSAARASRVPRFLRPLTTPIVNGRVGAAREEVCPEIATHLKIRGIASVTAPLATQWGDGMPGVPSSSGAGEIMMQKGGGLGILEFLESLEFVR